MQACLGRTAAQRKKKKKKRGSGRLHRQSLTDLICLRAQRALLEQAGRAVVDGLRTHIRALRGTRMSWMQRVRQTAETRGKLGVPCARNVRRSLRTLHSQR